MSTIEVGDVYVEELPLARLVVEASWQEQRLDRRRVAKIKREFDARLCSPLSVAIDDDGRYHIWDGQHRYYALLELGVEKWWCFVVRANSREQAMLFVGQTQRKNITGSNQHEAKKQYERNAQEIERIVTEYGYILQSGFPNTIRAVSAIYQIHRKDGAELLRDTLTFIRNVWPEKAENDGPVVAIKEARTDNVLDGVSTFLRKYRKQMYEVDPNFEKVAGALSNLDPVGWAAAANKKFATIKVGNRKHPAKKYESFAAQIVQQCNQEFGTKWPYRYINDSW